MSRVSATDVSKSLSYVLRHAPQDAGLALDDSGWADFEILKQAVKAIFPIEDHDLLRVIAENPKKRFTLDGNRIRAAQGHSVDVELALRPAVPPPGFVPWNNPCKLGLDLGFRSANDGTQSCPPIIRY